MFTKPYQQRVYTYMVWHGIALDKQKTDEEISAAIYKAEGNVTLASKFLTVTRMALYHYLEVNTSMMEVVHHARTLADQAKLDDAEETIARIAAEREADRTNSLRAARYTLDRKGKSRGWVPDATTAEQQHPAAERLIDAVDLLSD